MAAACRRRRHRRPPRPALREQRQACRIGPLKCRRALGAIILTATLWPAPTQAQEPHPCELVDCQAVAAYLRALPPQELIAIAWHGTGEIDTALAIARRESGFRCDADNPTSSAAGVFQHLSIHQPRAARLGFSWQEIAGPDCYADVMLAFDMWRESGWRPWR